MIFTAGRTQGHLRWALLPNKWGQSSPAIQGGSPKGSKGNDFCGSLLEFPSLEAFRCRERQWDFSLNGSFCASQHLNDFRQTIAAFPLDAKIETNRQEEEQRGLTDDGWWMMDDG